MTRLHVLLGGGGVGKTTLAAGYALALARSGRRVGLLGIDPSRRLHDALGLELADLEADVPGAPGLEAAILAPHQAIRRWAKEDCRDADELSALERNPFFAALSDRLASATDALAAVRIAEWAEKDPGLDDLVVDTAPGVAAVGFLRYPRDMQALLEGKLIGWLRLTAGASGGLKMLRFGARRVLSALGGVAGVGLVAQLADFFARVSAPLARMMGRLERAQKWLSSPSTELLLVTAPRDGGAAGARQLAAALSEEHLRARAAIVNRTWPKAIVDELRDFPLERAPEAGAAVLRHACAYAHAQLDAERIAASLAPVAVSVPAAPGLFAAESRAPLLMLGETLLRALAAADQDLRRAG